MIDLQRIEELIKGDAIPEDIGEEMFQLAYKEALGGTILIHVMIQIAEVLDDLTVDEIHMFLLGYAIGERDLEDAQAAMTEQLTDGNNTTH